jgi:hypothetical protein
MPINRNSVGKIFFALLVILYITIFTMALLAVPQSQQKQPEGWARRRAEKMAHGILLEILDEEGSETTGWLPVIFRVTEYNELVVSFSNRPDAEVTIKLPTSAIPLEEAFNILRTSLKHYDDINIIHHGN